MTATSTRKAATSTRKASAVRTLKVAPEALQQASAGLGAAQLPAELLAALQAGQAAAAAAAKPARQPRQYIKVPAQYEELVSSLEWKISGTVSKVFEPASCRQNVTENTGFYNAVVYLLNSSPKVTIWQVAALYEAARNKDKQVLRPEYILQRVCNIAKRKIRLIADTVALV